jgi:hypothetical protein
MSVLFRTSLTSKSKQLYFTSASSARRSGALVPCLPLCGSQQFQTISFHKCVGAKLTAFWFSTISNNYISQVRRLQEGRARWCHAYRFVALNNFKQFNFNN